MIPHINEHNEVIGETTIAEAKKNGWPRRVSRIFILDDSGTLLLVQKRNSELRIEPGKLDMQGGHVDVGETYLEAATREVQEELGIAVHPTTISEEPIFFENTFYMSLIARIPQTTNFTLKEDEVQWVEWVPLDDIFSQIENDSNKYTPWFLDACTRFCDTLNTKENS